MYKNEYGSDIYNNKIYHPFYELEDDVLDTFESWITNEIPTYIQGQIPTVYCHYEIHYQYNPKLNNGKHSKNIFRPILTRIRLVTSLGVHKISYFLL